MYNLGQQFVIDYKNAKSNEKAIFKGKKYRITILTERLIRFEYNEKGIFEDRLTQLALFRNFDVPSFEAKQDEKFIEITTKYFKIEYAKEKNYDSGAVFAGNDLRVSLLNTDKFWYYRHPEVRNYLGVAVSLDSLNGKIKLDKGLYSIDGFASIDDSDSYIIEEDGTLISKENKGIDLYLFMYRQDFNLCLKDYFALTGKPPIIPRYALGNWWSRDLKYSDTDIKNLVKDFERNKIPLSVILLDKDWHIRNIEDKKDLVSGYTWNKQLFPTPYEFISYLHSKKIRLGLNINPKEGIWPHEDMYSKAITYLETQEKKAIPFAPYNPRFIDVYLKLLIHPQEILGVDMFWLDYDENKKSLLPLWILNHYHFLDMERTENKRGVILSRSAMKAPHRYPILYSGKTLVSWETLKMLPYVNATASNIGVSWWSHDIGGHHGGIEDKELYIRYVQLGVFSPILRFHGARGKYYKREPWLWDVETVEIVKNYLVLRHRLIPYLYTEAYHYYKNAIPLVQPLYYKYPKMYDDLNYRNEYYFGSELLVAPIIDKKDPVMNRVVHRFFLPDGIWYDFNTGKKFPGGQNYVSFYKDECYPVFARGGSIIPLSINAETNDTSVPVNLEINIFPGRSNVYKLYEDDGISRLYKDGYYLLTSIDYNYRESNYTVIIRALEGKSGIIPNKRNYKIKFRNTKQADEVMAYFNEKLIDVSSYIDGPDFIIEVKDISTIGQLTVNCKGKDIEINTLRYINEEIDSIISDLQIETLLKESIANILFRDDYNIKKKRIEIRKLGRKGLKPLFIKLFLKLLEYIEQI